MSGGYSFMNAKKLFEAIRGVLDSIETVTLQAAFLEWMDRSRKSILANGNYTEEARNRFMQSRVLLTQYRDTHFLVGHHLHSAIFAGQVHSTKNLEPRKFPQVGPKAGFWSIISWKD
jgi:hypothetical protein